MVLSHRLRQPKRTGILVALVANIKQATGSANTLYNQFTELRNYAALRTRYNCQQGSLQALLNKLFDPSLNRIYLVTAADTLVTNYGSITGDDHTTIYGKTHGETVPVIYGYTAADYNLLFDGYVYCPVALMPREAEIRKWVDFNIFLGKTYTVKYF